jgi:CRISPR-associated endonuclease/helicase Cas3
MVRKELDTKQAYRHEVIGALLCSNEPGLGGWLFHDLSSKERDVALAAVIGHHLKAEPRCWFPRDGSSGTELTVFTEHPDFHEALGFLGRELGLPAPPSIPEIRVDLVAAKLDGDVLGSVGQWWKGFNRQFRGWSKDDEESRFLALVKALLIAADVAGSAIPRSGEDPAAWSREVLTRVATSRELRELATIRLDGKPLRLFQEDVAISELPVTLARAGCGSGKTTAAYLWASSRGDGRKLFFCYPTTGTATEGFGDYVLPGSLEGRLIHGRAEVDLENLLTTTGSVDLAEWQPAFEALSSWDVPLSVCTADTVLGLIQSNRRGLCSIPAIGQGAFVFDEIHAYDGRMFGALLRFLRVFRGAPVLLMTASLPLDRQDALLKTVGADRFREVCGPPDLEELPRYLIRQVSPEEAMSEILACAGKVLWVSNTVARCVGRGQSLEAAGRSVLPYHSRYRYQDRVERHRQVVDSFKAAGPSTAVTTQVCEMSLDLSADLLVTDLAPIPALIQRLGRLNRRATPEEPGEPKPCLVLEPEHPAPYSNDELELARRWLDALGQGSLSQSELAREFEALASTITEREVESAWLDGGPVARCSPLRDAGYTAPFIRGEDRKKAEAGRDQRIRLEIPMTVQPVAKEFGGWARVGPNWVAPVGRMTYSDRWGGEWVK